MKSIDVKSLLIGFLLCATFFLYVGATEVTDYPIPNFKFLNKERNGDIGSTVIRDELRQIGIQIELLADVIRRKHCN